MTIIGWFLIVTLKWAFKHRKQFSKIKNWLIVEIKCHLFKLSWRVYAHLCIGFIVFPFRIFFLLLDVLHRHLQQRFFLWGRQWNACFLFPAGTLCCLDQNLCLLLHLFSFILAYAMKNVFTLQTVSTSLLLFVFLRRTTWNCILNWTYQWFTGKQMRPT